MTSGIPLLWFLILILIISDKCLYDILALHRSRIFLFITVVTNRQWSFWPSLSNPDFMISRFFTGWVWLEDWDKPTHTSACLYLQGFQNSWRLVFVNNRLHKQLFLSACRHSVTVSPNNEAYPIALFLNEHVATILSADFFDMCIITFTTIFKFEAVLEKMVMFSVVHQMNISGYYKLLVQLFICIQLRNVKYHL